jgi:hypothetical protein
MFLSELNLTCDGIKQRIHHIEEGLESETQMTEEVAGNVRSAIGKANLLLSQKLSQFRELCVKNINGTRDDGFETKIEDLEGFWEMVSIQVQDIHQTFDEMDQLKANHWVTVPEATSSSSCSSSSNLTKPQPKMKSPRKSLTPKGSPAKGGASTDTESAAARDAARKSRLREAKRKHAARLKAAEEQEVTIFMSQGKEVRGSEAGTDTETGGYSEAGAELEVDTSGFNPTSTPSSSSSSTSPSTISNPIQS